MSLPSDVPELAAPSGQSAVDAEEVGRCLEEAARMVQEFTGGGAPTALTALLTLAEEEAPGPGAQQVLKLAKTVTKQTETLHSEVERFLATTQDS